jgi:hypothetical protein
MGGDAMKNLLLWGVTLIGLLVLSPLVLIGGVIVVCETLWETIRK